MNKEDILRRIARYLMLYTSHQKNLGLLDGKMGIAVFFFHYAEYAARKVYKDFAEELIGEIYKEIHVNCSCNFRDGLPGIAWGVEYLIRNRFVTGNADEILEDLDRRILERDVRRIQDHTPDTGLKGLAYYVISRCANRERSNVVISDEYIIDLIKALGMNVEKDDENTRLIYDLKGISARRPTDMNAVFLDEILEKTTFGYKRLFKAGRPLGISDNGYAGIGLKIMSEDETKSIYL